MKFCRFSTVSKRYSMSRPGTSFSKFTNCTVSSAVSISVIFSIFFSPSLICSRPSAACCNLSLFSFRRLKVCCKFCLVSSSSFLLLSSSVLVALRVISVSSSCANFSSASKDESSNSFSFSASCFLASFSFCSASSSSF